MKDDGRGWAPVTPLTMQVCLFVFTLYFAEKLLVFCPVMEDTDPQLTLFPHLPSCLLFVTFLTKT